MIAVMFPTLAMQDTGMITDRSTATIPCRRGFSLPKRDPKTDWLRIALPVGELAAPEKHREALAACVAR